MSIYADLYNSRAQDELDALLDDVGLAYVSIDEYFSIWMKLLKTIRKSFHE
jgi:hypothetical protein